MSLSTMVFWLPSSERTKPFGLTVILQICLLSFNFQSMTHLHSYDSWTLCDYFFPSSHFLLGDSFVAEVATGSAASCLTGGRCDSALHCVPGASAPAHLFSYFLFNTSTGPDLVRWPRCGVEVQGSAQVRISIKRYQEK